MPRTGEQATECLQIHSAMAGAQATALTNEFATADQIQSASVKNHASVSKLRGDS